MLVSLPHWLSPFIFVFLPAFAAAMIAAALAFDRMAAWPLWLGVSFGAALAGGACGLWLYRRFIGRTA